MVCIHCNSKTSVTNTRAVKRSGAQWRRRHCPSCKIDFTSIEQIDLSTCWVVVDADGKQSPFSRDRLLISLNGALRRADSSMITESGDLADTCIQILRKQVASGTIELMHISTTVYAVLGNYDPMAALAYGVAHHIRPNMDHLRRALR